MSNVVELRRQADLAAAEPRQRQQTFESVTIGGVAYKLVRYANSPSYFVSWREPIRASGTQGNDSGNQTELKRRKESLETRDLAEARMRFFRWVEAAGRPKDELADGVTIRKLFEVYLEKPGMRSVKWAGRVRDLVLKFFAGHGNPSPTVADLTDEAQLLFVDMLADPTGINYKVTTIVRTMGTIKSALGYATKPKVKLLKKHEAPAIITNGADIAEGLEVPKAYEPKPELRRLTLEELAAFFDAIRARHFFRYCILACATLARPEAICDIDRAAVLWDDNCIRLNPTGRKQTKKRRPTVGLPPSLGQWFKVWDRQDGQDCGRPRWYVHRDGARVGNVSKAFREVALRAKLLSPADFVPGRDRRTGKPCMVVREDRAITPYTLRRSIAHIMRQRHLGGVMMDEIAAQMGHTGNKYATTEIYAYLEPEQMEEVSAGIERVFALLSEKTKWAPIRPDDAIPRSCPAHQRYRVYGHPKPATTDLGCNKQ